MELVYTILLHISSLIVLGSAAGTPNTHSGDRKKWNLIGLNRFRRDLQTDFQPAPVINTNPRASFVKTEDMKDPVNPHTSNDAHIRVKRYRQNFHNMHSLRVGCRFGTCTVQNLAHQIFQYTDKDKDSSAPVHKISSQGYGRRRRSIPDKKLMLPIVDGKIKPWWVSTRKVRSNPGAQQQLLDITSSSRPNHDQGTWTKGKMWESLLRT
ncbi:pro-adrenomedullin [Rhinophrynus dorsalis]